MENMLLATILFPLNSFLSGLVGTSAPSIFLCVVDTCCAVACIIELVPIFRALAGRFDSERTWFVCAQLFGSEMVSRLLLLGFSIRINATGSLVAATCLILLFGFGGVRRFLGVMNFLVRIHDPDNYDYNWNARIEWEFVWCVGITRVVAFIRLVAVFLISFGIVFSRNE
jgi:hypothetical protein